MIYLTGFGQVLYDVCLFFILGLHAKHLLPLRKQRMKYVSCKEAFFNLRTQRLEHRVVRVTCQSEQEQSQGW